MLMFAANRQLAFPNSHHTFVLEMTLNAPNATK
jgi:hypothetical protein